MSKIRHLKITGILVWMFFFCSVNAQKETEFVFVEDTMTLCGTNRVLEGEYLEVVLRDLHVVRLFKTADKKVYLRFIVTRNFYFDKVGTLEILSGSKTYSAKEVRQHKITKTSGLFETEIFSNYLSTLAAEGISALIFNQAKTDFSKADNKKIRRMAEYFQNAYVGGTKKSNL